MPSSTIAAAIFLLLLLSTSSEAIRPFPQPSNKPPDNPPWFLKAPQFHNSPDCSLNSTTHQPINVAMTLDFSSLRGTIAAIFSILTHTSCPNNLFFRFVANSTHTNHNHNHNHHDTYRNTLRFIFPWLRFEISTSSEKTVNNAPVYLADLHPSVDRVIYLDSDVIVLDDIVRLWNTTQLPNSTVIAAPEYCNANISSYFTQKFWRDLEGAKVFENRRGRPCYFNAGVMVMDLARWREGNYTEKIQGWMEVQKKERIFYENESTAAPLLLVFAGELEGIDHRWNQHGLGEEMMKVDGTHPGPISLLHWSGKEKPWERLDQGKPFPVDQLWAPYDLYGSHRRFF